MAGRLDGRTAVITGSGSGIGQAIAERLASEGANCVIDYVDHVEEADQTLDKIKAAGGKAVLVQADVSVVADCNRLIESAWSEFGFVRHPCQQRGNRKVRQLHRRHRGRL